MPRCPRSTPCRVADETFLVHDHIADGDVSIQLNSMLIRGEQPVVVDTGAPVHAEQHLDQLFGLVEPADVRWVFLSHEDPDHAGNLRAVMAACAGATLVTSWLAMARLVTAGLQFEPERWCQVEDGDFLDIGDRVLVVERPPLYDSPSTLGLFDTSTDVFWAADCFGSTRSGNVLDADELSVEQRRQGLVEFQQWHSPWMVGLDARWWNHVVDRLAARKPQVIASAHGPLIRRPTIDEAIDLIRELPQLATGPQPDRSLLDRLLSARPPAA